MSTMPIPVAGVVAIQTDLIEPDPEQPRKVFEQSYIESLGETIKAQGLKQPIVVRPKPGVPGRYLIKQGERRWRAHCCAGLRSVNCIIDDAVETPGQRFLGQMVENMARQDMTLREECIGIERLIAECGLSEQQVSSGLGIQRPVLVVMRKLFRMSDVCWQLHDKKMVSRLVCEKAVNCLPVEDVEGVLLRCSGKGWKQAVAIINNRLQEAAQSDLNLLLESECAVGAKNDVSLALARQLLSVAAFVEKVPVKDQSNMARMVANEVIKITGATKKNRKSADFLYRVFNHLEAVIGLSG